MKYIRYYEDKDIRFDESIDKTIDWEDFDEEEEDNIVRIKDTRKLSKDEWNNLFNIGDIIKVSIDRYRNGHNKIIKKEAKVTDKIESFRSDTTLYTLEFFEKISGGSTGYRHVFKQGHCWNVSHTSSLTIHEIN